jgi:hypothetical protein
VFLPEQFDKLILPMQWLPVDLQDWIEQLQAGGFGFRSHARNCVHAKAELEWLADDSLAVAEVVEVRPRNSSLVCEGEDEKGNEEAVSASRHTRGWHLMVFGLYRFAT